MPRLSKHTLEKMYPCPYCGKKLRQLNGLSGHIQWAHASGIQHPKAPENKQFEIPVEHITQLMLLNKINFMTDQEVIAEMAGEKEIKAEWYLIAHFLKEQNIVTNESDYKNYLIFAKAISLVQERLLKKLITELSLAIRQAMQTTG